MARFICIRTAHLTSYSDPISVGRGDALVLDGREDLWDGHRWLWAVSPDGREGWVPDDLIGGPAGAPAARFAYSAIELACKVRETVEMLSETHGWVWCRNAGGHEGWVPLRCLQTDRAAR